MIYKWKTNSFFYQRNENEVIGGKKLNIKAKQQRGNDVIEQQFESLKNT